MNQMQQMLMQAQKMQRELKKAHEQLEKEEFKVSKSGMVEITMLGSRVLKSISIDKDALEADNKEMLEESISLAINEAIEKINKANDEIETKITGQQGMLF
ncbi:MAG TPA: nucleoid-associated protein, YbaB/EbfC family [Firmicutes bacterium]|nr:nucleoid-associated protein, YbaB/EbfC family [Bacillota bacterium]